MGATHPERHNHGHQARHLAPTPPFFRPARVTPVWLVAQPKMLCTSVHRSSATNRSPQLGTHALPQTTALLNPEKGFFVEREALVFGQFLSGTALPRGDSFDD